jgi:uncharacterized hydrophobic protein (TIGR00271 family)
METKNNQDSLKQDIRDTAQDAKNFLSGVWTFIKETFKIRDEVDFENTKKEIQKGLRFEGARVWILSASIIIASIGLNIDSVPVIIGAMLIAPLMSPILGIGTSLGTNDWGTLKLSLKGLIEAVGVSLAVATIYFMLSPINAAGDQITSRTIPTLLDVIIALGGGIACIVSFSLKDKGLAATVIPGVAVATALMPPLCTAGYGIAHMNLGYFLGAFYLFILNAIFIALPAYAFVRMMKFKKVHASDKATDAKQKKYIMISLAAIVVPSIFLFVGVVKDSMFRNNVDEFVENVVVYGGSNVIDYKANYENYQTEVFMIGGIVPDDVQESWKRQLDDYGLDDMKLKINQAQDMTDNVSEKLHGELKAEIIEDLYKDNEKALKDKDEKIKLLEEELAKYGKMMTKKKPAPFIGVEEEIAVNYSDIEKISYSELVESDLHGGLETIPTLMIKWKEGVEGIDEKSKRLVKWLKLRVKLGDVKVVNY